jgi:potassium efflux system protein
VLTIDKRPLTFQHIKDNVTQAVVGGCHGPEDSGAMMPSRSYVNAELPHKNGLYVIRKTQRGVEAMCGWLNALNWLKRPASRMAVITAFSLAAVCLTSWAEDKTPSSSATKPVETTATALDAVSLDQIKAKRAAVEGSQELGESIKKSVLSLLDQAIRFREMVDQLNRETEENAQKINLAPERLKAIETELERPIPTTESVEAVASKMETDKLEQQIRQNEAELANAKTVLSNWSDQFDKVKTSPQQLSEFLTKTRGHVEKLREELKVPTPKDETAVLTEVRRMSLLAEHAKSQAEIKLYEQQLVGHEVLLSLLTAERDLALREVSKREILTKAWQVQGQKRRQMEAKQSREEAEEAKDGASALPFVVQDQFDINIKLGEELEKLTQEDTALATRLQQKKAQLKGLEEEFALARERVQTAVLTEAIGIALREQRKSLPDLRSYRRDSAQRQLKMTEVREAQLNIDRKRRELADLDAQTERIIQSLSNVSESERASLKTKVRAALIDRRDLLGKLQTEYLRSFKNFQELEFTEQQLTSQAKDYAEFLDSRLLWIRSTKVFGPTDMRTIPAAISWVVKPSHWWHVIQDVTKGFKRTPEWWVLGLLLGVALLAGRRRARSSLVWTAKKVGQVQKDSFGLTFQSLVMTLLIAAGWPFIMGFVGWQLLNLPIAYDFTRSVSSGLISAAKLLAIFGFFYRLCRKDGLADVHFKWPEATRLTLRDNLLWLTFLVVLLGFLISTVDGGNISEYRDSLGRLAFMGAMAGFSVFAARVLRFSDGILSTKIKSHSEAWAVRLRYIWYPMAVGMPLLIAALAVIGYQYAALTLWHRLHTTFWFLIGLVVINDLLLRWLFITRRRLAWENYKRKKDAELEAARTQQAEVTDPGTSVKEEPITIKEPELDLVQVSEQTRNLLKTLLLFSAFLGLWAIWKQVLPALEVIGDIQLWSYRADVDGVTKTLPITLANLVLAFLALTITIVAARNLPGVLEITLLNYLPMDKGARYAFTTLCRYAIGAVGIIVVFSTIGVKWSSLQWLVAALGVGLGFGLQEIVANFVCGLIVLFERPYRIGDFVTVGDIYGTVTRIRIRATTITDLDRRELIVPNKEFITGKLINWSLSDPITRVVVQVGVVYGSDTALAEKLLLKVANENPTVIKEPEPSALFLGFGDNSLNFELRVFIKGAQNRFLVMHRLHQEIDREFRKANLVIAFPQRDVHLDTDRPLEVRIVPGNEPKE